jgi:hypothetical protein
MVPVEEPYTMGLLPPVTLPPEGGEVVVTVTGVLVAEGQLNPAQEIVTWPFPAL